MPLAQDVELAASPRPRRAWSGPSWRNLVNEAALLAARASTTEVDQEDFSDALEKIVLGGERRIMLFAEDGGGSRTTRPATPWSAC